MFICIVPHTAHQLNVYTAFHQYFVVMLHLHPLCSTDHAGVKAMLTVTVTGGTQRYAVAQTQNQC